MYATKAVVDVFKEAKIELVLGLIGHGNAHLADELFRDGTIRSINPKTETAGTYMSYGFNKALGRLGSACLWHIAGMSYASPGVQAAYADSTPLLVVSGNTHSEMKGKEPVQETDIESMYRGMTKWVHRVERAELLPQAIRQAFLQASTGRPRPCVVDVPYDKFTEQIDVKFEAFSLPSVPFGDPKKVAEACEMLLAAKRPVLRIGGGCEISGAHEEVRALAELLCLPVVYGAARGKGEIPDTHPLCLGPSGVMGWNVANDYLEEADVWCNVGSSFSQFSTGIWTLKPPESLIHIDIDPYEIGKLISAKVGIVGDARAVLRQMLSYLEGKVSKQDFRSHERFPEIERRRQEYLDTQTPLFESAAKPIHPMRIMKELRDALPDNAIITADSGQNAHWVKRGFMARGPRTTIIDSRYAILGFGFPAALGAKLARPEAPVVCFTGDGGFYYHAMELSTAVEQNIPVVVVIDNNGFYNSNKSLCDIYYEGRRIWVDLPKTDWVGLAKSLGASGERVDEPGDIGAAIQRGIASGRPYVIDVITDPQVYPKRSMGQTHRMRWDISETVKKK